MLLNLHTAANRFTFKTLVLIDLLYWQYSFLCALFKHDHCITLPHLLEKRPFFEKQECIPVGCVPPAAVAVRGGLHQAPPGPGTPPGSRPPSLWTESQTPVKISPCPNFVAGGNKLNISTKFNCQLHWKEWQPHFTGYKMHNDGNHHDHITWCWYKM